MSTPLPSMQLRVLQIGKEVNPKLFATVVGKFFGTTNSATIPVLSVFYIEDPPSAVPTPMSDDEKSTDVNIDDTDGSVIEDDIVKVHLGDWTYRLPSDRSDVMPMRARSSKDTNRVYISRNQAEAIDRVYATYRTRLLTLQEDFCQRIAAPVNDAKAIEEIRSGAQELMMYWAARSSLPMATALGIMDEFVTENYVAQMETLIGIWCELEPLQVCDVLLHFYHESRRDLLSADLLRDGNL